MALSLKGTGIATNLVLCLAVDDDGTTIKEFVSTTVDANKTLGTGVASGVGSATWNGTSRGYFPTLSNGAFDYFGVRFASGFRPSWDASNTHAVSVFAACAGMSAGSSNFAILEVAPSGTSWVGRSTSSGPLQDLIQSGGSVGSTSLPTDNSTKFSVGLAHTYGSTRSFYYGLESGSLAADGSAADDGRGSVIDIFGVGGATSQGNNPAKYHVFCLFNKALSLGEFQSLHGDGVNDWFTTLFATGGSVPGGAMIHHLQQMGAR